jgi:hypothetical protein
VTAKPSFARDRPTELNGEQHARQENFASTAQSLLLNPNFVALLVRSVLILLEFGSRPLKNAKKMLSCALICYWLYHYRFGSEDSVIATRLDMSKLEPSSLILAQNAPLIVVFLVMKLSLKLADLSSRFVTKAWKKKLKRMRFAKLFKLYKLTKVCKFFAALSSGRLGVGVCFHTLKYFKLLKLLKISSKCKCLLSKRQFKAFKIFKAYKVCVQERVKGRVKEDRGEEKVRERGTFTYIRTYIHA